MKRLLVAIVAVMATAVAAPTYAANGFTLSGTATLQGNKVELVSDFSDAGLRTISVRSASRFRPVRRWRR